MLDITLFLLRPLPLTVINAFPEGFRAFDISVITCFLSFGTKQLST